jgi:hypothetical protein
MGAPSGHAAARALTDLRCILGRMPNRIWLTVAATFAALFVLSCASTGTNTEVGDTAEAFFRALANDPPRAYTYLSTDCQEELTFLAFASQAGPLSSLLGDSEPSVANLHVLRGDDDEVEAEYDIVVHTNGQTVVIAPAGEARPTTFVREDGGWRFASCDDFSVFGSPDEADGIDIDDSTPTPSLLEQAVEAEADDTDTLPGEYVNLPAIYQGFYGNRDGPNTAPHTIANVDYEADGNSNPPAGGPHWGRGACGSTPAESEPFCGPVPWGIYRTEWQPESLVHNMEHGGVVVWYNTVARDAVDEVETLVTARLEAGDIIVMAPYLGMEEETMALTSWSRIDMFPVEDYSAERVVAFLDAHVRRFNPEGF